MYQEFGISEELEKLSTKVEQEVENEFKKIEKICEENSLKVLQAFQKFLGKDIIIGHNVNFDIDFIYDSMEDNLNEYLSNDYIDTLRISSKVLPNLKHHKLDNLIDYFNLVKRNEHRALNDCILTNQVYINLANYLK